jgi:hypothetical protein
MNLFVNAMLAIKNWRKNVDHPFSGLPLKCKQTQNSRRKKEYTLSLAGEDL